MNTITETPIKYEEAIISIVQRLPVERLPTLFDYASFLEYQEIQLAEDDGDKKWDELLARPESKSLLREMAREARAEFKAGKTTEIGFTDDGRLKPV